ncbi:MAG: GNAT family N-acetyltransferase [Actinobacteria bacterium]|nr:GNAT family N-acetyltransferase [Actinomycetota bacterium]
MTADYALEPVEALDPARTGEVRRIYEDGFAPHLRSGFATLTTEREEGEIALALLQDGQPCGFAMLRPLGHTGWIFLRYFVVSQQRRGQGLGGIMWDQLMAWLQAGGYRLLVWDVEDADEPGTDPGEVHTRQRRVAFYQRHGGRLLPVKGYGNPHGDEWTPMRLMAARVGAAPAPGPSQTPAILAAVYQYRYRLDQSDPRVSATEVTMAVEYELADSVAWIRLNRPQRLNAVVPELVAGLIGAFARAEQDGARAVVLAGRGRAFCSGHDLKEPLPPETVLATRRRVDQIQEVTRAIRRFPGPVIAAVHGYALGAGCEFALGCDLVVAAEDAQFGFPEVSVGLSVTGGISRLLPLLVGPVRAKELLLLGERFGAVRAQEWGLVNQVAPAGEHEQVAAGIAARLRDRPALALALAKQALDRGAESALEEAMATETDFAALTVAPETGKDPGNEPAQ